VDDELFRRLRAERDKVLQVERTEGAKKIPKRVPTPVATVNGERFQVKGEEKVYEDPCDAIRRARALGAGSEVIRLSDGKLIAEVPGYIPPPPREWT
jgi:hypothetical protein